MREEFFEELEESLEFLESAERSDATRVINNIQQRINIELEDGWVVDSNLIMLMDSQVFTSNLQNLIRANCSLGRVFHLPDRGYTLIEILNLNEKLFA